MTRLFVACIVALAATGWLAAGYQKIAQTMAIEALIDDLASTDGAKRTAATGAIFGRGKAALPDLKKAGAKQVAPVAPSIRRLDMVYSILEGFPLNLAGALAGYSANSFALHVERGTTEEEVAKICQKYKLTIQGQFVAKASPNCFVTVQQGAALEEVFRQILSREPKVVTISLNYFER
jgi:hypothetical protein